MTDITVLGAGSWGTALAIHLARQQVATCLWGRDTRVLELMQHERCNSQYLPGIEFPEYLHLETDLATAVTQVNAILVAVPSHAFASIIQQLSPLVKEGTGIICATKGIDPGTSQLLHTVILHTFGPNCPFAILSGPSFSKEVARGLPTAITLASPQPSFVQQTIALLRSNNFRIYRSQDYIGVQLCGAIKNVIAIAAGISDGLGYGANARAAIITRGLAEMSRLGLAMGAAPETFMGLAGVGDLVLTCTDDQSRNRRFGLAVGQGADLLQAEQHIGQVVEGITTTAQVCSLAHTYQVDMPIATRVQAVLQGTETAIAAVAKLLTRPLKDE